MGYADEHKLLKRWFKHAGWYTIHGLYSNVALVIKSCVIWPLIHSRWYVFHNNHNQTVEYARNEDNDNDNICYEKGNFYLFFKADDYISTESQYRFHP